MSTTLDDPDKANAASDQRLAQLPQANEIPQERNAEARTGASGQQDDGIELLERPESSIRAVEEDGFALGGLRREAAGVIVNLPSASGVCADDELEDAVGG